METPLLFTFLAAVALQMTHTFLRDSDCEQVELFAYSWNCFLLRAITFLNHTVPDFTDNGASNFMKYGNDYFATSETNYIRKIDPVTLETQDKVTSSVTLELISLLTHDPNEKFSFKNSQVAELFHTGGLLEVSAGKPGFIPSTLWQRGQCLQHGNFNSREGQDEIHAVQSPCCCRERYKPHDMLYFVPWELSCPISCTL